MAIPLDLQIRTAIRRSEAQLLGGDQTFCITGFIETVSDKTIPVFLGIPFDMTITAIVTICSSGTCVLTGKINTTALGGSANSVSSSRNERTHSSSNDATIGDDINITISSNSSCLDLAYTIFYTRTLA